MLKIHKIKGGDEGADRIVDYLFGTIDDPSAGYYGDTSKGDPPGIWIGGGVEAIGKHEGQTIDDASFRAIMSGRDPETGEKIKGWRPNRVVGYDLNFTVPKGVSVLWALGDEDTRNEITEALAVALSASMEMMEREGIRVTRGNTANGGGERYKAKMIGGVFAHRVSRPVDDGAPDPHLHQHVVLANYGVGPDGALTALDQPEMFAWMMAVGETHNAIVRQELTRRLGVTWTPVNDRGVAQIAGMDERLMERFSRRQRELLGAVEEMGLDPDNEAHRVAGRLATRKRKEGWTTADLIKEWREAAAELGIEVEDLAVQLQDAWTEERERQDEEFDRKAVEDDVLLPGTVEHVIRTLEDHESYFSRQQIVIQVARTLEHWGVAWSDIEAVADQVLESAEIVEVGHSPGPMPDGRALADKDAVRYTTERVVEAERSILSTLAQGREAGAGQLDGAYVDRVLDEMDRRAREANEATGTAKAFQLGDDQRRAVHQITTDGHRVSVLCAPAGFGKSTTLRVARQVWEGAGYQVVGATTAAKAARELEKSSGIAAETLARIAKQMAEGEIAFSAKTVLVIDENGMTGTLDMNKIVQAVTAKGGKVVMVGDPEQLSPVAAGGVFADIAQDHSDVVATLETNYRQREAWEKRALDRLRVGRDLDRVLALYRGHGSIRSAQTEDETLDLMVDAYFADLEAHLEARKNGEDSLPPLMLAYARRIVSELNERATARAEEMGLLGEAFEFAGREWRSGQRVILTANQRQHGLLNGVTGTVHAVGRPTAGYRVTVAIEGKSRPLTLSHPEAVAVGDTISFGGRDGKVLDVEPVRSDDLALVVETDEGEILAVPEDYAADESALAEGWAITTHRSQGTTCRRAHVWARGMDRHLAYVALSRGKDPAAIYLPDCESSPEHECELHPDPEDHSVVAELQGIFEKSWADESVNSLRKRRLEEGPVWAECQGADYAERIDALVEYGLANLPDLPKRPEAVTEIAAWRLQVAARAEWHLRTGWDLPPAPPKDPELCSLWQVTVEAVAGEAPSPELELELAVGF